MWVLVVQVDPGLNFSRLSGANQYKSVIFSGCRQDQLLVPYNKHPRAVEWST